MCRFGITALARCLLQHKNADPSEEACNIGLYVQTYTRHLQHAKLQAVATTAFFLSCYKLVFLTFSTWPEGRGLARRCYQRDTKSQHQTRPYFRGLGSELLLVYFLPYCSDTVTVTVITKRERRGTKCEAVGLAPYRGVFDISSSYPGSRLHAAEWRLCSISQTEEKVGNRLSARTGPRSHP